MKNEQLYKSDFGKNEIMNKYDEVLKRWPVKAEQTYVETKHGKTFVLTCGKSVNPPIVFLHGSGSNSAVWGGIAKQLSDNYSVYAIDTIGEPGKSAPNRPSWNSDEYAEWLNEVFSELNIRSAILAGISQGGWIASKYASFKPQSVSKLILISPAGIEKIKPSFILSVVFYSILGNRGIRLIKRLVFGKEPLHPEIDEYVTLLLKHFNSRMDRQPVFSEDDLKKLTMPVMLLAGEKDPVIYAVKSGERLKKLLPNFENNIIPKVSHLPPDMSAYIKAFIEK